MRPTLILSILLLIIISFCPHAKAKTRFSHINTQNGLAHTDVLSTFEDSEGYIWFATHSGLQCYDGYKLTTFNYYDQYTDNKVYKYENRVVRVAEGGDRLFVATRSGLTIFNKTIRKYEDYTMCNIAKETLNFIIYDIVVDSEGYIYMRTQNDFVVAKYDDTTKELCVVKRYQGELDGVKIRNSVNLWRANKGVYLVMRFAGIIHLKVDEQGTGLTLKRSNTPSVEKRSMIVGSYYVGEKLYLRYEKGVVVLSVNKVNGNINTERYDKLIFKPEYSPKSNINNDIVADKNGDIWYGHREGLVKISNPWIESGSYTMYRHNEGDSHSLSSTFISDLFIDSNSTLWVSTWGGGVNYRSTKESQFGVVSHIEGDNNSISGIFVKSMERDDDGYLWIASQGYGVEKYDFARQRVVERYSAKDDLFNTNIIKSLKISADQRYVYVGSLNGLYAIDKKLRSTRMIIADHKDAEAMKQSLHIYNMDIDKWGNLWCATWQNGVVVLAQRDGKMEIIHSINNVSSQYVLSSNVVTDVVCDGNRVWVSTDAGLNRVDLDDEGAILRNTIYSANEDYDGSISCNFISCIAVESDSVLWIGTLGGGLNRVTLKGDKDYRSEVFTTNQGLPNNDVEGLEVDRVGNVWISGGQSIAKFEYPSIKTTLFSSDDGLQSNTFKVGSHYQDSNGILYFGGTDGFSYFNPLHIRSEVAKGKLVFSSLLVRDEASRRLAAAPTIKFINYLDELRLKSEQSSFIIEFSALNFTTTNKIKYRYKIDGLSNDWTESSREYNQVAFSDVKHGRYNFRVEASYDGGESWDEAGARSIAIQIIPPWYQSNLASIMYVILFFIIIATIFLNYRERTKMKMSLHIKSLEKSQQEENHQMKLQFFTNISHEFRTPLTIIMTAIESLKSDAREEQYELIDSVTRNTKKMLSLISQLMDFRKTETKRDQLHATYEVLNTHIKEITTEFDSWAQKKNIELCYTEQREFEMWFDREKMSKIVWNLISNAIKYTDKASKIEVILSQEEYSNIKPYYGEECRYESNKNMGECVVLRVKDCGIGIMPESLPHIFDRYFQIESKTSLHLGSGIGLAVVKNMVLSHSGNIIVSSRRDSGTEFIVAISLDPEYISQKDRYDSTKFSVEQYLDQEYMEQELKPAEEFDDDDIDKSERERILIVEDNVELLALLRKHFISKYEVITAIDGVQGLKMVEEHNPDIVISDVMMPNMDGVEMCRNIRENVRTISTPIILLTAKSEVEDQIEGLESGANLYLSKPFTTRILDLHISRLLSYKEFRKSSESIDKQKIVVETNEVCDSEIQAVGEDSPPKTDICENEFIKEVTALVIANLDNTNYSVTMMCEELAIGRTRLYTKVKEITGESLGDMIRNIRITRAAELLATTNKNISEVIYEVGICSNSHFSKAFKQHYGLTPSDYAKQMRRESETP